MTYKKLITTSGSEETSSFESNFIISSVYKVEPKTLQIVDERNLSLDFWIDPQGIVKAAEYQNNIIAIGYRGVIYKISMSSGLPIIDVKAIANPDPELSLGASYNAFFYDATFDINNGFVFVNGYLNYTGYYVTNEEWGDCVIKINLQNLEMSNVIENFASSPNNRKIVYLNNYVYASDGNTLYKINSSNMNIVSSQSFDYAPKDLTADMTYIYYLSEEEEEEGEGEGESYLEVVVNWVPNTLIFYNASGEDITDDITYDLYYNGASSGPIGNNNYHDMYPEEYPEYFSKTNLILASDVMSRGIGENIIWDDEFPPIEIPYSSGGQYYEFYFTIIFHYAGYSTDPVNITIEDGVH